MNDDSAGRGPQDDGVPPVAAPPPHAGTAIEQHRIAFSGDGGEYFGVWMVNVLLTLVTVGLFTPFARRRTVRYFYGHTRVAGSPLEFTAPVGRMLFGFVLLLLVYGAFQVAGKFGPRWAVVALYVLPLPVAPWLWRSAMRFRLANTRWRGLRLYFTAGLGEIYLACWPIFAVGALWLAVAVLFFRQPVPGKSRIFDRWFASITPGHWTIVVGSLLATALCVVLVDHHLRWRLANRTRIGSQRSHWQASFGDFLRIWGAALGLGLLAALALGTVIGGLATLAIKAGFAEIPRAGSSARSVAAISLLILAGYASIFATATAARAYREARIFHLTWNRIGIGRIARFRSTLDTGAYVRLRVRNVVLTLISMSLYRPFARVQEHRMKAESVTLYVRGGLDALIEELTQQQLQQRGGFADAAAEAVGLDLLG